MEGGSRRGRRAGKAGQEAPTGPAPGRGTSLPREPGPEARQGAPIPAAVRGLRACPALPLSAEAPANSPAATFLKKKTNPKTKQQAAFSSPYEKVPPTRSASSLSTCESGLPPPPAKGHQLSGKTNKEEKKPQTKRAAESAAFFFFFSRSAPTAGLRAAEHPGLRQGGAGGGHGKGVAPRRLSASKGGRSGARRRIQIWENSEEEGGGWGTRFLSPRATQDTHPPLPPRLPTRGPQQAGSQSDGEKRGRGGGATLSRF